MTLTKVIEIPMENNTVIPETFSMGCNVYVLNHFAYLVHSLLQLSEIQNINCI